MTTHESDAASSRRAALRGEEREAAVVTMLQELAPHLAVEPDPEFRTVTRQRLVAMAAVRTPEPAPPSALRRLLAARAPDAPAGRWRIRATAALAGAALTVTSLATLVALSTGARPGDVLYGLKRGTEQTQVALAGDSRGQILLDLASTRLDELRALDGDAALAESTLATMDDQTSEGASWFTARALETSDPAPLDRLSSWAAEQSARLGEVRAAVPAPAADDVDGSLGLLGDIAARAEGLRAGLVDCPAGPATSGSDRLGPVPAGCLPAPSAPQGPADPGGSGGSGVPGVPVPGGVVPAPPPVPGVPGPEPTAPAGPTGQQPPPATGPSPAPGSPPAPVPGPAPTPGPGLPGPLPNLPLPSLTPQPSTPAPTSAPPSVVNLPLPLPCLSLPLLLRVGRC